MATNTYVALATTTLSSAQPDVTFSSISGLYTDLILVAAPIGNAGNDCLVRFNSDTATNYSNTFLYGSGTAAASGRGSNNTSLRGNITSMDTGEINSMVFQVANYSNTTTYKTVLNRYNSTQAGKYVTASVGLWRNTAAINSISITTAGSGNFGIGSTFSLYGVAAEGVSPAVKATGGAIYSDSTYYYHVFGASGTFTPLSSLTADVLSLAGGGGGGGATYEGGGGGAGGVLGFSSQSLTATGYTVTVGAGGAGGINNSRGSNGNNSQFGALTACVGGGAGANRSSANGGSGGSGGGGTYNGGTGGSGTSGQGFAGGSWVGGGGESGGGGGAGGAGSNNTPNTKAGNGGAGVSTVTNWGSIANLSLATGIGVNGFIAGGGGGGANGLPNIIGTGGSGGGGNGNVTGAGVNAVAFTGSGGGGGGGGTSAIGGNGGSGVVIVRYLKA